MTPLPPSNTTPPPPNKQISPLVIGLFCVIVILLGALVFAMSRASKKPNLAPSPPVAAPTASPEASASPTPGTSEPGEIVFGRSVDHMKLSGRTDLFAPKDSLAYVATSPEPFSATMLEAKLTLKDGRGERILRSWDVEISGPENKEFSQSLSRADALIQSEEPGTYVLRLIRDGKTLCKGEFSLRSKEKVEPENTIDADGTPLNPGDWPRYLADSLGVRFRAPEGWTVKSGRDGQEVYVSIRKSETPPISMKLSQNPPSDFDAQDHDKREAFGKKYHRISLSSDRKFQDLPTKSWNFEEMSDSVATKQFRKFQFDKNGKRWQFSIVAPSDYYSPDFELEFQRVIDSIEFN
ncbi:hypothetical protein [Armatimonas sp.]|uniref:hypothetical protein n=1 Tax=Armatimonas sp. TaxID=1872638 RepID=UPI00286C6E10|nr:hypothetical protein [Armatimonas sp.]